MAATEPTGNRQTDLGRIKKDQLQSRKQVLLTLVQIIYNSKAKYFDTEGWEKVDMDTETEKLWKEEMNGHYSQMIWLYT